MIGAIEKRLEGSMMNRVNKKCPDAEREEVLCIPLFSILEAIRMTHIRFFSLDVEGAEFDILQTIPFDKVKTDLFVIENAIASGNGLDSKTSQDIENLSNSLKRSDHTKKYILRIKMFFMKGYKTF